MAHSLSSGFIVFKPWSHTDRRHMLFLESGPYPTRDEAASAQRALPYPTYLARLELIQDLFLEAVLERDKARRRAILDEPQKVPKTLPFLGATWSPRAPQRLKIETRQQMLCQNVYDVLLSLEPQKDESRQLLVLELLDRENAKISP